MIEMYDVGVIIAGFLSLGLFAEWMTNKGL